MRRVLFLCSRNWLRSPTAEQVFAARPGLEVASAGLSPDAEVPCTPALVDWADIVFVMERRHRTKLAAGFRRHLKDKKVICLDIPDTYAFMAPELIRLLEARVGRHLPKPYMAHVIETFGFDRVMYGSDWSVFSLTHAYADWVAILDDVVAGASVDERRVLYRGTASRVYRLAV